MHFRTFVLSLFAVAACVLAASPALSAPTITRLSVRGFQAGSTTTVVIDGTDLLPSPRLISSARISSQTLKPGATAANIKIDVTIDAATEPGFYNVWLVTDKGVSPIQVFAVDSLPQLPLSKQVAEIPVALHGNFTGSRPVETSFPGKAGQRVTIEVEAQRLGGKEQPVIHLLDSDGRELALALPSSQLHGDSRLITTLPTDGMYTVRVHDLQYAGLGALRLRIGSWQYADIAFPPAIERGKTTRLELIGPEGEKQQVDCTPAAAALMPAPWPNSGRASGMRPVISVTTIPELIEDKTAESPMVITGVRPPFAISGRLSKPGEVGRFKLDIDPEATLRFSVIAAQIGSPIDAVLEIRGAKGELLAANDDVVGSSDPQLEFKAPKGLTSELIEIRDTDLRGSDASVYRLVVNPVTDKPGNAAAPPDFDLFVDDNVFAPPLGGMKLMKVIAVRRGYDGPIALRLADAPENFELQRAEIPAGADAALVMVVAKPGSPDAPPAVAHLIGESRAQSSGEKTISRQALFEQHPLALLQPWLGNDLLLAAIHEGDAFAANYVDDGEASREATCFLAEKVTLPVRCMRPVGLDGAVRLTLLTSQIVPLQKNTTTPDLTRALRPESAIVTIAADAKAQAAQDASDAAEKVLADAEKAAKAAIAAEPALEAKVKQAADALAKVKPAPDAIDSAIDSAKKALADAEEAVKAAQAAAAALDAKVKEAADALAKAKAAQAATDAAEKILADAANAVKVAKAAAPALDAKVKQATAALAKAKAAQAASVAAEKVLADAEKALKVAQTAALALDAKVKSAADAVAKAKAAAEKASQQAKNSTEVALLVPADLPPGSYDLAFKAELLGRDTRTVLSTSYTPVKRLNVLSQVLVKLDGAPHVEVRLDASKGAVATWSGMIDRLGGFKGDVALTLEGLPRGVLDPKVIVAADKSEFIIELKIPPATEAGQTPGIKLFATMKPDPKAAIVVRSPNVDLALDVLPVVKAPPVKAPPVKAPKMKVPAVKVPDKVAK